MRVTIRQLRARKRRGEKIAMLTAYDAPSARIVEAAGIPIILVGDSVGNNVLGYDTTVPVTMDEMIHHVKAVVRGTETTHIVADMPFMSFQADATEAMRNAGRLLKEGGAQSVKLEGGRRVLDTARRIVEAGIPVMGHIGFTPQSINQMGHYRFQGRTPKGAQRLVEDAQALEEAGVYALVLETVPAALAETITSRLTVPTIGIGAGVHCDGQVLILHDLLGLDPDFKPKHARRYAELGRTAEDAIEHYIRDIQSESFPSDVESITTDVSVQEELSSRAS